MVSIVFIDVSINYIHDLSLWCLVVTDKPVLVLKLLITKGVLTLSSYCILNLFSNKMLLIHN